MHKEDAFGIPTYDEEKRAQEMLNYVDHPIERNGMDEQNYKNMLTSHYTQANRFWDQFKTPPYSSVQSEEEKAQQERADNHYNQLVNDNSTDFSKRPWVEQEAKAICQLTYKTDFQRIMNEDDSRRMNIISKIVRDRAKLKMPQETAQPLQTHTTVKKQGHIPNPNSQSSTAQHNSIDSVPQEEYTPTKEDIRMQMNQLYQLKEKLDSHQNQTVKQSQVQANYQAYVQLLSKTQRASGEYAKDQLWMSEEDEDLMAEVASFPSYFDGIKTSQQEQNQLSEASRYASQMVSDYVYNKHSEKIGNAAEAMAGYSDGVFLGYGKEFANLVYNKDVAWSDGTSSWYSGGELAGQATSAVVGDKAAGAVFARTLNLWDDILLGGDKLMKVSFWGRNADKSAGWVMKGDATRSNYYRSGKFSKLGGNQVAKFEESTTITVPRNQVSAPKGGLVHPEGPLFKGIFGQRIYKP